MNLNLQIWLEILWLCVRSTSHTKTLLEIGRQVNSVVFGDVSHLKTNTITTCKGLTKINEEYLSSN